MFTRMIQDVKKKKLSSLWKQHRDSAIPTEELLTACVNMYTQFNANTYLAILALTTIAFASWSQQLWLANNI